MNTNANLSGVWHRGGWFVLAVAAAGTAYVFTSATAQEARPNAVNRTSVSLERPLGPGNLSSLFAQFQSISSLHFRADVEVTLSEHAASCCLGPVIGPANLIVAEDGSRFIPPIPGAMEYWMSGDRYRVNNYVDPNLYPGMDTQFAYDGQRFQLLRPSAGMFSFSSQDNDVILPTLPNPILELVQFCYPVTDANLQRRLRFKDIIGASAPIDVQNVTWTVAHEEGRSLHRAVCPGGTYEGRQYVHHVYAAPNSHNKPKRIDRITVDGVLITSSEFSRYIEAATPDGPTFWPQRVVLKAFDDKGARAGKISFNIMAFSLNAEPPRQEVFSISTEGVERAWDDDLQQLVQ